MDSLKQLETQKNEYKAEQVNRVELRHEVPVAQVTENINPSIATRVKGFFVNIFSRLGLSTTSDVTEIELEDFAGPVNAQQVEHLNDMRLIDGDMSQIRLSETIPIEGRTVSSNLTTASDVAAVKTSPEIKKIELNPVVPLTQEQKEYTYYQTHNCQTMASDMKACADAYTDIAETKKALVKMVRKDENGAFISELDEKNAKWNDALKNREEDEIIKDVLGEIRLYLFTNKSTLGFFSDYIECPEHFHRIVNIVSFLSTKTNILGDLNNEMLSVMKDQIKNSVIFYKQSYNLDILKDSPLENDPEFRNLKANKKQAANLHSTALKNTTTIREKLDEAYSKIKDTVTVGDKKVELERGHILTEANIYENSITDDQNYAHVINNPAYFGSIERKSVYGNTDNEEIIPEHAKKDSKLSEEDKKNAKTLCGGILKSLDTIESYATLMKLFSSDTALDRFQTSIQNFRTNIKILLEGKSEQKDGKEVKTPPSIVADKYFTDQEAATKIASSYVEFTKGLNTYLSAFNSQIKRAGMPNVQVNANYEALKSFMKEEILLTQVGNLFSIAQMQMSLNSPELKKHYFLDAKKLEYIIKSDVKNDEQWPIPESDKAIEIITGNSAFEKAWLIAKLLIKTYPTSKVRKEVFDTYSTFSFTEKNNICRWLCIIQDNLQLDTSKLFETPELELSIRYLKTEKQPKAYEKIGDEERKVPVARTDIKLTGFGTEEDSWAHATALMLKNYGYTITPEKVKEVVQKAISENKISADVSEKISKNGFITLEDIKGAFASVFGDGVLQEINLTNHRNPEVQKKGTPTKVDNVRLVKDTIAEAFKNDSVVVMYVDGHFITITDFKLQGKDDAIIRYQDSRQSGHDKKYPKFDDEISKKLSSLFNEHTNFSFADVKLYWMKKDGVLAPVSKTKVQKKKEETTEKKETKQEKVPEHTNPSVQIPKVIDLKYTEFQPLNDCWAYSLSLQLKSRGVEIAPAQIQQRCIDAINAGTLKNLTEKDIQKNLLSIDEVISVFADELGGKDKIHLCTFTNHKTNINVSLNDMVREAGREIYTAINTYSSPVSMLLKDHYVTVTGIDKDGEDFKIHYQDSFKNHHTYSEEKDPSHEFTEYLSHLIDISTITKEGYNDQVVQMFWTDNSPENLTLSSDEVKVRHTL